MKIETTSIVQIECTKDELFDVVEALNDADYPYQIRSGVGDNKGKLVVGYNVEQKFEADVAFILPRF